MINCAANHVNGTIFKNSGFKSPIPKFDANPKRSQEIFWISISKISISKSLVLSLRSSISYMTIHEHSHQRLCPEYFMSLHMITFFLQKFCNQDQSQAIKRAPKKREHLWQRAIIIGGTIGTSSRKFIRNCRRSRLGFTDQTFKNGIDYNSSHRKFCLTWFFENLSFEFFTKKMRRKKYVDV